MNLLENLARDTKPRWRYVGPLDEGADWVKMCYPDTKIRLTSAAGWTQGLASVTEDRVPDEFEVMEPSEEEVLRAVYGWLLSKGMPSPDSARPRETLHAFVQRTHTDPLWSLLMEEALPVMARHSPAKASRLRAAAEGVCQEYNVRAGAR